MKSTLTDQEIIDASAPAMRGERHGMRPEHFAQPMLDSMRAIADAAVARAIGEPPRGHTLFPPPTRPAPPMPKIRTPRPDYETLLRDEFAGRALAVLPAHVSEHKLRAKWCYQIADAMLEARNENR